MEAVVRYCRKCGKGLSQNDCFCPRCGTAVDSGGQVQKQEHGQKKASGIAIAIVLAAVLIGVAIYNAPFSFLSTQDSGSSSEVSTEMHDDSEFSAKDSQDAGDAKKKEAAQEQNPGAEDALTIVMDGYTFSIPEYWRNKVDVLYSTDSSGYLRATICPRGVDYGDAALVIIGRCPTNHPRTGGDYMSHSMYAETQDGYLVVRVGGRNWPAMANEIANGNEGLLAFTHDKDDLELLVDLSSGGKISYEQAVNADHDSDLISIEIEHTQGIADSVSFESSDTAGGFGGLDIAQANAFYDKLMELEKEYGEPEIAYNDKDGGAEYLKGLAYARLMNFGDNQTRLVVCYYDPARDDRTDEPGAGQACYPVEVWEYDKASAKLVNVFECDAALLGQNIYCTAMPFVKHDGLNYLTAGESVSGPSGFLESVIYGVRQDGSFGEVSRFKASRDSDNASIRSYEIDGVEASEDEATEYLKAWDSENAEKVYLNALSSTDRSVQPAYDSTLNVISTLAAITGKTADTDSIDNAESAKTIDAVNCEVTLAGTVEREEKTTSETMMAWSAVVYWLVFDEPVEIRFVNGFGETVTKEFERISVFQLEQYLDDADRHLENIVSDEWQPYVGEHVEVRGMVVDTGNAHTFGWAQLSKAAVV